jgi:hypothetical protein
MVAVVNMQSFGTWLTQSFSRASKIMLMGSKDGKKMVKLGSASIDFSKYIEQTDFAGLDLKSLQVCTCPTRQPVSCPFKSSPSVSFSFLRI